MLEFPGIVAPGRRDRCLVLRSAEPSLASVLWTWAPSAEAPGQGWRGERAALGVWSTGGGPPRILAVSQPVVGADGGGSRTQTPLLRGAPGGDLDQRGALLQSACDAADLVTILQRLRGVFSQRVRWSAVLKSPVECVTSATETAVSPCTTSYKKLILQASRLPATAQGSADAGSERSQVHELRICEKSV